MLRFKRVAHYRVGLRLVNRPTVPAVALPALTPDPTLAEIARRHSRDMAYITQLFLRPP